MTVRSFPFRALLAAGALLLAVGCEGSSDCAGADGQGGNSGLPDTVGGPAAVDIVEHRRDLSSFFADGEAIDVQEGIPMGHIPEGATEQQLEALERVNWYRWRVGLLPIDLDLLLSDAALRHSECYQLHFDAYSTMSPHDEDPNWLPPCMGAHVGLRAQAAGVHSTGGVSEVIAFTGSPTSAVDGWVGTLYHRIPIVDPATKACGYGEQLDTPRINTMNCSHAQTAPDIDAIVMYPEPDAEDQPVSWDGLESPQPPVPPTGYPSGPIITLTMARPFVTVSEGLFDEDGNPVAHQFLTGINNPNIPTAQHDEHLEGTNTICLYAHDPLEHDTTYTVRLQVDTNDLSKDIEWSFTTVYRPW